MKRRALLIFCSCLLLAALSLSFVWIKQECAAPVPEPSAMGGYYEDAFTLYLDAPANGKIYYTTDGSIPTEDSILYEDGIPLYNRSNEPNLYTAVQNVIPDWKTYTPSQDAVAKGTVIRSVFVNDWGVSSDILTQTYFVGIQPPERGYTMSLVFQYDDLFGDNGLYVTGQDYDAWYLYGDTSEEAPTPNFEQDLEVRATAELLGESGDILNQAIGLKLQGATARSEVKKRFTLVSREEYSGSSVFDTELFEGISTHSVMLKTYFPDAIVADLVSDRDVAVQRSIPIRLFLNGEYWYDCYMLEKYDETYFQQHYQAENRIMVKNGVVTGEIGTEAGAYQAYMEWAADADFSDADTWAQFQKEVDVQNYIDYLITNYYLCNIDISDDHNCVLWRSLSTGGPGCQDGRWRYCIYDIDALAWMPYRPKYGNVVELNAFSNEITTFELNDLTPFHSLRGNPEFCRQFVLSFMDMLNNNFAPENVEPVLKKYGYTLDWMDGYFRERPAYAVQHLAEEFSLTGSLETVTISTAQPEMGSVIVNTSQIDLSDGSWQGEYFTDYPVTVTACPSEGYQFLGWKGDADSADATLTLSVDGGLTLEPVFAKVK